jgi:hypothetical protein
LIKILLQAKSLLFNGSTSMKGRGVAALFCAAVLLQAHALELVLTNTLICGDSTVTGFLSPTEQTCCKLT